MSKVIKSVYINKENVLKAQVKAANEDHIFKLSELIDKLIQEYVLKVGEKEETG